jgi:hypothetical protein
MLKIYDTIKDKDLQAKIIPIDFMKPPFRCVIVGYSGSGKTNVVKNILFNKEWGYNSYFDQIFVFCGSSDDVREYNRFAFKTNVPVWNEKKQNYYKSIKVNLTEKMLIEQNTSPEDIKDLIMELEDNDLNNESSLFVFDDMIVDKLLKNTTNMNVLDEIYVRGRHIGKGISVIITTQKLRAVKQNLRFTNSTHLIVFHGLSPFDLDIVVKENSGYLTFEEFRDLYNLHVDKKYRFIVIHQKGSAGRYIQNDKLEWIA